FIASVTHYIPSPVSRKHRLIYYFFSKDIRFSFPRNSSKTPSNRFAQSDFFRKYGVEYKTALKSYHFVFFKVGSLLLYLHLGQQVFLWLKFEPDIAKKP